VTPTVVIPAIGHNPRTNRDLALSLVMGSARGVVVGERLGQTKKNAWPQPRVSEWISFRIGGEVIFPGSRLLLRAGRIRLLREREPLLDQ